MLLGRASAVVETGAGRAVGEEAGECPGGVVVEGAFAFRGFGGFGVA